MIELTAVIVGAFGAIGVITGLVTQRRTEREKLTEQRVMDLLDRQSDQISGQSDQISEMGLELANHRQKLGEAELANREQGLKLAALESKNEKLWRLFTVAIENLTEWIQWDQSGRTGLTPQTRSELRKHLPFG